jgi:hypothetical protein
MNRCNSANMNAEMLFKRTFTKKTGNTAFGRNNAD